MYYFITQDLDDVTTMNFLGHSEESGKRLWINGVRFSEPFPKDTFYVKPCMGSGKEMPDFFDSSVPVMSKRLLTAFTNLGVDNIDVYQISVKEENTDEEWSNYFAINFIGLVDAIDREQSEMEDEYTFHSTVIDKNKAQDLLCFRLFCGPTVLVIHEKVAKKLMNMNLKGVLIVKTENYDEDDF
ncbi:imm11 family protein [Desulfonema magnum]|uniref:Immunity MXAN-0049 protein domain-containing protein n=1 Tax=Desulfonema magnum TaxID=45655 RepID=A0A975BIA0_9BACT|nr:DUF1629 domain-containing protein [Desulfonema magnum]QTA85820.1 Uncharacterized protein dnm_018350 [Desulfonema magnum]